MIKSDNNIKVVCRLRPLNSLEMSEGGQICVEYSQTLVSLTSQPQQELHDFTFDRIFGPNSNQKDIYDEVALPILDSVVNGYNGTILAYGQTSSGKTFTMEGPENYEQNSRGLIPRVMYGLFDYVQNAEDNQLYVIKVSFLEIYKEKINDLLDNQKVNLSIKEDKIRGIYVQNLTEIFVNSPEEMQEVMNTGSSNRTIAATRMNERSSRSHSLFTISLLVKNLKSDSSQYSKLQFVDLAGSEKIAKTQATGQQLEEAKNINKSLSCLGMVINALTGDKKEHIPYRDSKLTRILSESLGGNSKTTLIVACSMCTYNDKETISTLRFGARAKTIKNKPKINQSKSPKELQILLDIAEKKIMDQNELIMSLSLQIQDLVNLSAPGTIKGVDSGDISKNQCNQKKMLEQYLQIVNLTEENEKLKTELASKEIQLQNKTEEMIDKITKLKVNLEHIKGQLDFEAMKTQRYVVENERLKHQLQENELKVNDFKRALQCTKVDIKYLLNSLSIKSYGSEYITDTESTRSMFVPEQFEKDQEEKALNSLAKLADNINTVENLFLKYEPFTYQEEPSLDDKGVLKKRNQELERADISFISVKQDEQKILGFLDSQNASMDYFDDDFKMLSVDPAENYSSCLHLDEESKEEDMQKVINILSEKIESVDNLYIIQDLFIKQRKIIQDLAEKHHYLHHSKKQVDEQYSKLLTQYYTKLQSFKLLYQKKKSEMLVVNQELHKQIVQNLNQIKDNVTNEYSSFRQSRDSSLNILQQQNLQLSSVLDVQKQFMANQKDHESNSPLSKEFQLECTIKQMMLERSELFKTIQDNRVETDNLRKLNKKLEEQQQELLKIDPRLMEGDVTPKVQVFAAGPYGATRSATNIEIPKSTRLKNGVSTQLLKVFINNSNQSMTQSGLPELQMAIQQVQKQSQLAEEKNLESEQKPVFLRSDSLRCETFDIDEKPFRGSEEYRDLGIIIGARSILQRETPGGLRQNSQVLETHDESNETGLSQYSDADDDQSKNNPEQKDSRSRLTQLFDKFFG